MVTAPALDGIAEAAAAAFDGPPVRVNVGVPVTTGLLERLSDEYEDLWFEAGNEGEIVITGPAGGAAAWIGSWIAYQIQLWIEAGGGGTGRDAQGAYHPPNGRQWGPDASWLSDAAFASLGEREMRGRFWPVAPDFVVEIVSPSQKLADQQQKMRDWIAAEVKLGMLISPDDELIELYRADGSVEIFNRPDAVSCDPVMPGFTLRSDRIWRQ